jgi:choline-sulfatase
MSRPNIIFLHIDQQNLKAIGAHGCAYASTPAMDRMLGRAVSFDHCVMANPLCMPSRSSWYTGLMPEEHGQIMNAPPYMDESIADIGPLVASGGYDSIYMGKWHLARDVTKSFDLLYRGHPNGEQGDAYVARSAEAFLATRQGDKPFFLNIGLLNPHDCCAWAGAAHTSTGVVKSSLIPGMVDQLPPLPPNHYLNAFPTGHRPFIDPTRGKWSDLDWRYYMYCYYRHVEMVDAELERIFSALENSRFADNTLLIFASDHGEGLAQHYHYGKQSPMDHSLIAPLAFIHPGLKPRRDTSHVISSIDVTATICDFAGVDPLPGRRGLSIRPLLDEKKTGWRAFAPACPMDGQVRLVRTTEHKLINDRITNEYVMYDLVKDPWEMKNVVADPAYSQTLAQLKTYMDQNEATYHFAPSTIVTFENWRKSGKGPIVN